MGEAWWVIAFCPHTWHGNHACEAKSERDPVMKSCGFGEAINDMTMFGPAKEQPA